MKAIKFMTVNNFSKIVQDQITSISNACAQQVILHKLNLQDIRNKIQQSIHDHYSQVELFQNLQFSKNRFSFRRNVSEDTDLRLTFNFSFIFYHQKFDFQFEIYPDWNDSNQEYQIKLSYLHEENYCMLSYCSLHGLEKFNSEEFHRWFWDQSKYIINNLLLLKQEEKLNR